MMSLNLIYLSMVFVLANGAPWCPGYPGYWVCPDLAVPELPRSVSRIPTAPALPVLPGAHDLAKFDANEEGQFCFEEVTNWLKVQTGRDYAEAVVKAMMAAVDNNHDGTLNMVEFWAFRAVYNTVLHPQTLPGQLPIAASAGQRIPPSPPN